MRAVLSRIDLGEVVELAVQVVLAVCPCPHLHPFCDLTVEPEIDGDVPGHRQRASRDE